MNALFGGAPTAVPERARRRTQRSRAKHLLNKYCNTRMKAGVARLLASTRGRAACPIRSLVLPGSEPMRYRPPLPHRCSSIAMAVLSAVVAAPPTVNRRAGRDRKPPAPSFSREIRPILAGHCFEMPRIDHAKGGPRPEQSGDDRKGRSERAGHRAWGIEQEPALRADIEARHAAGKSGQAHRGTNPLIARWIDAGIGTDGAANQTAAVVPPRCTGRFGRR